MQEGVCRVLVVDDDVDVRNLCLAALSGLCGWDVLLAEDAHSALEALERERVDVVLLDLGLPGGGTAVLEALALASRRDDIRVILLTAASQEDVRRQGRGALGVVAKPFDPLSLGRSIERILAGAGSLS